MDTVDQTIPFVSLVNWVRAARQCGVDMEAVLRDEGLDMAQLHPTTAVVSRATMHRIMSRCVHDAQRMGSAQPFPIVLGELFAFEYLADVDTFIATSSSLRDAGRVLDWVPQLLGLDMRFSLMEFGAEARLALHYDFGDVPPALAWSFTEATFAAVMKFSRALLGEEVVVNRLSMRYPPHELSDACHAYHQVPVEYDAPVDALWFDRVLLDKNLKGAFPTLHKLAAQRVEEHIEQQANRQIQQNIEGPQAGPLAEQIERVLIANRSLLGEGLPALARELGMHTRTLQRRLKELGEAHSLIQDRVRYSLARQWLTDSGLSIEDISERLGYSDRRGFTLAFRRWSGQTPSQYRRKSA